MTRAKSAKATKSVDPEIVTVWLPKELAHELRQELIVKAMCGNATPNDRSLYVALSAALGIPPVKDGKEK